MYGYSYGYGFSVFSQRFSIAAEGLPTFKFSDPKNSFLITLIQDI